MLHFTLMNMITDLIGNLLIEGDTYKKRIFKKKMKPGYVKFLLQGQIKCNLSVL